MEELTPDLVFVLKVAFGVLPIVQMAIIIILVFVGIVFLIVPLIPQVSRHKAKALLKEATHSNQVASSPAEMPLLDNVQSKTILIN